MNTSTSPTIYTISEPFWKPQYRGTPNQVRTCFIEGLSNTYQGQGDPAPIDAGIAELIVALNRAGFATQYCCSGLDEDHRAPEDEMPRQGYISFVAPIQGTLGPWLPDGLYVDEDDVIRSFDVRGYRKTITQNQLKLVWDLLLSNINIVFNAP